MGFFLGRTALHESVLLFRTDCHPQHSVINNIQLLLDYGTDVGIPVFLFRYFNFLLIFIKLHRINSK